MDRSVHAGPGCIDGGAASAAAVATERREDLLRVRDAGALVTLPAALEVDLEVDRRVGEVLRVVSPLAEDEELDADGGAGAGRDHAQRQGRVGAHREGRAALGAHVLLVGRVHVAAARALHGLQF